MRPRGYNQTGTLQPADPDPDSSIPPVSSPDDPSVNWHPEQFGESPYTEQPIDTRYEHFMGIVSIPVAGPPGTPPKIVTLHAPYAMKTVHWTTERQGEQNRMPHWNTGNSYEQLAYKTLVPAVPLMDIDGKRFYRTSGTYCYCIAVAPTDADTFAVGSPAYDLLPADENILTPASFDPTLIAVGGASY